MNNAKKRATSKPREPQSIATLTRAINESIEGRKAPEDHLNWSRTLGASYKDAELGLHPEVVIHALSQRWVSLYQELSGNRDNDYCLILLNSLANSLGLCVNMYHNQTFYGNVTGKDTDEKSQ